MTKKYQSIILIFVLFSSLSAGLTQAQPELGNWELGIEYPEDDSNNSFIIIHNSLTLKSNSNTKYHSKEKVQVLKVK